MAPVVNCEQERWPRFGASKMVRSEPDEEEEKEDVLRLKCVFVGDGSVGKTSLVVSYTTNGYPQEYIPTAFDNYSVLVRVDNQPVRLQLCDTAGQVCQDHVSKSNDDFNSLRQLAYPDSDVFLLCFNVVSPASFYNLAQRWLPELKQHAPNTPIILVGTQIDLRLNVRAIVELNRYNESPVTEIEAKAYAREIGAVNYLECSALTQHNLKEVFDQAILAAMLHNDTSQHSRTCSIGSMIKQKLSSSLNVIQLDANHFLPVLSRSSSRSNQCNLEHRHCNRCCQSVIQYKYRPKVQTEARRSYSLQRRH